MSRTENFPILAQCEERQSRYENSWLVPLLVFVLGTPSRRLRSRLRHRECIPNQVHQISVDGKRGQVYIPLISMKRK